jgi:mono/diheme cytochrome c family protein
MQPSTFQFSAHVTRLAFLALCLSLFMSGSGLANESVELFPAGQAKWQQAGPGSFSIENGIATSQGGMGLWWYAGKAYANATFDIEFQLPNHKWNSGIFIRFPDPGNDPWVAVRKGYECQVNGDKPSKSATGGIFSIQAPSHMSLKKPGDWNHYQITTWQNKILIVINDELVNVFTTQPGRGDQQGYIGLQNHDPKSQVQYRQIAVREWAQDATLDEVQASLGITRADWANYQAQRNPRAKWYQKMDIGPAFASVFEDHYHGEPRLAALKGLCLELSASDSIRGLFDTETLRMSSAFQGGLHWSGTPWTGAHGGIIRMANDTAPIMQTSRKPGWADKNGSFADPRPIKEYGNLAEDHARFNGHYRHGSRVILDYSVLGSRVLELPTGKVAAGAPAVFRQLDLAACEYDRLLLVADDTQSEVTLDGAGTLATISQPEHEIAAVLPQEVAGEVSVVTDHTTGDWDELTMGAPSDRDAGDRNVNKKTTFRVVPGYLPTHVRGGAEGGVAVRLNDGLAARNKDDVPRSFFFADQAKPGRLELNLDGIQELRRIHLYSHHKSNRAPQSVEIYGAVALTADATLAMKELPNGGWTHIAGYSTSHFDDGGKHGAAILAPAGEAFGAYRKLLFICVPGRKKSNMQTFFSEIDLYGKDAPALKPVGGSRDGGLSYMAHLKSEGLRFSAGEDGALLLRIPASKKPTRLTIGYAASQQQPADLGSAIAALKAATPAPRELASLTHGTGPALFPETVEATIERGTDQDTWAVDTIGLPVNNPWFSMIKPGGLDLFTDGDSAAICTWNGDVWIVKGLKSGDGTVHWQRFATGLYEPLGLRIVDDIVYVNCRDQITRLHDQNQDGEADRYECFNNDVYITANFHEFTFGLQTDQDGNFYLAKGAPVRAGGRGFERILPHNGTLLRIAKDGKKLDVIATGLRAPGGIGVGPNGEITTGENEGSWQPCCKLNYFTQPDTFLGVEDAAHQLKGQAMHLPLCYFPMRTDNSGGGQVWVPPTVDWGLKAGELIHLSYGKSSLYRVLRQEVDGLMQGGVVRIPVTLNSSAMRARFHQDGSLYVLGFRGWQTNAAKTQGLQRIRYTGQPVTIPNRLEATEKGIYIGFEKQLDPATVADPFNFKVERWKYIRCGQYGSGEFSIDNRDLEAEKQALVRPSKGHRKHDQVRVARSVLLPDGKTLFLVIPSMKPAEQMSIRYTLTFADATKAHGEIIHTVHRLGKHLDDAIAQVAETTEATREDLKPGLHQTLTVAEKSDHRVARLPAQYTAATDAVSDMLPAGPFSATWSGYLVLEERMSPRFTLEGTGAAALIINGATILEETGTLGRTTSAPLHLDPGAHSFQLSYTGASDGSGHVRVLWQTETFFRQSIPAGYFKHEPNPALSEALTVRRGRDLLVQQSCLSCHSPGPDLGLPELADKGPDLSGIGSRVSQQWLGRWLASPHSLKPGTTMPATIDGKTQQGRTDAADIAAYLVTLKGPPAPSVTEQADDAKHGGARFHALGCIACHSLPDQPYDATTERTPLNNVHSKYNLASLSAFLKKPDRHHPSIKMPDFRLTDDEARQLAVFLRTAAKGKALRLHDDVPVAGDATRGKQLIAAKNCAACHSGLPAASRKPRNFTGILRRNWDERGCVAAREAGVTPQLNLTQVERADLEAFRRTFAANAPQALSSTSSHDFAQRQVQALNCAACHEHDDVPSRLASLHSQSQSLSDGVPADPAHAVDQSRPALTYTGEMLHSDYLQGMLEGSTEPRPRPWLAMRMPTFHGRAILLAQGLGVQHGMPPSSVETTELDAEQVSIGKKLTGATGGFACTICHGDGDTAPLAAFEVKGINFDQVAVRLRPGYYHQWMENPHSITPTTKMPRYTQNNKSPLPDFDHDARKQFDAMLEYLKSISKD